MVWSTNGSTSLIDAVAAMRRQRQLVMVGPVVTIDPAGLPMRAKIHRLGLGLYGELLAWVDQAPGRMSSHSSHARMREPMRCAA